jgi:hypothetical protein
VTFPRDHAYCFLRAYQSQDMLIAVQSAFHATNAKKCFIDLSVRVLFCPEVRLLRCFPGPVPHSVETERTIHIPPSGGDSEQNCAAEKVAVPAETMLDSRL